MQNKQDPFYRLKCPNRAINDNDDTPLRKKPKFNLIQSYSKTSGVVKKQSMNYKPALSSQQTPTDHNMDTPGVVRASGKFTNSKSALLSQKIDTDHTNDVPDLDNNQLHALKATLLEAISASKDISKKVNGVVSVLKKHLPAVFESLVENDCQPTDDTNSLLKGDRDLVDAMTSVYKEFDSIAFTLETVPECSVVKQPLLRELQTRENQFEEMFLKFKNTRPWQSKCLDKESQVFIQKKYENYNKYLEMKMSAIKNKIKAFQENDKENGLDKNQNEREPLINLSNGISDQETLCPIVLVTTSPASSRTSSVRLGSPMVSSPAGNRVVIENGNKPLHEEKNKQKENTTDVNKKGWPGKSLPDLYDLYSMSESEQEPSSLPSSVTNEAPIESPPSNQDESLDNILTGLTSDQGDVGNHFLASQGFASVSSSAMTGFQYNVDLTPKKKSIETQPQPQPQRRASDSYKCRACFKIFNSIEEVKVHEREHKNAFYYCKNCAEVFLSRYEQQKHISEEHIFEKSNICKVCYEDFADKMNLLKHLRASHYLTKNKPPKKFICMCCNQHMPDEHELIRHMRQEHQDDIMLRKASKGEEQGMAKNKCRHCMMFFKNMKIKAIHEIIIHESPPFQCPCNKGYFSKGALDEHMLKHSRMEESMLNKKRSRMSV